MPVKNKVGPVSMESSTDRCSVLLFLSLSIRRPRSARGGSSQAAEVRIQMSFFAVTHLITPRYVQTYFLIMQH